MTFHSRLSLFILSVFLCCAGCTDYGVFSPAASQITAIRTFNEAKNRWQNRPFANYEFTLTYYTPGGPCDNVTIIVKDGFVAEFEDRCHLPRVQITTIDGLFDDMYQTLAAFECGPNGCQCDGFITIEAEFDEQYGYPTVWHYAVTGNLFRTPPRICTEIGIGASGYHTDSVSIDSLVILPPDE